jgi:hypothetical protein
MTRVKLDKTVAEDLLTSKLRILKQCINEILARWDESSTTNFLEKARSGIYKEAEDNAVELRQLLLNYTKFQEILNNL